MSFKIYPTSRFKKEAKRLTKKYPSLRAELIDLNKELLLNPFLGTPLGHQAYKIRIAIKSKGKGKSGGARIITYAISNTKELYLLTLYDKSEMSTLDDKELRRIIGQLSI